MGGLRPGPALNSKEYFVVKPRTMWWGAVQV
ncbi:hypothetical protein X924_08330 [Petrotoga sp. 9PWA.NaAc.5.4]|nr:hypothetical protein X924_08330 [Petrotoga sp. 9PWA.NaAc.5.4]